MRARGCCRPKFSDKFLGSGEPSDVTAPTCTGTGDSFPAPAFGSVPVGNGAELPTGTGTDPDP